MELVVIIKDSMIFETHDNGGRKYQVTIEPRRHVTIRRLEDLSLVATIDAREVFIGKSPKIAMTKFSGGHGRRFDGNSILLRLDDNNTYMFIGTEILIFRSLTKIVDFVSPVGNSDVPYPWAVDDDGNYYLFIENVVLLQPEDVGENAYEYYYTQGLVSEDPGYNPPKLPVDGYYNDIRIGLLGEEVMTLSYNPHPGKDFDRLMELGRGNIALKMIDGSTVPLNRKHYVSLMKKFGNKRGFRPLKVIRRYE